MKPREVKTEEVHSSSTQASALHTVPAEVISPVLGELFGHFHAADNDLWRITNLLNTVSLKVKLEWKESNRIYTLAR